MASSAGVPDSAPRLGDAVGAYLSTLPVSDRESTARELSRFTRWMGSEISVTAITPLDVSRFQEQFSGSAVDVNSRLQPVKDFLTHLRARKLTTVNLAAHVRLKRAARTRTANERETPQEVLMTEQGHANLVAELAYLESVARPKATDDLKNAYGDRDFRENAPYDAAKHKLGEVQGRINEIRAVLGMASIYTADSADRVDLGTIVTLRDLREDEQIEYWIVGPGEVSAREGKISRLSPIGKALIDRRAGEVVDVETPAGVQTFRIEKIERRDR